VAKDFAKPLEKTTGGSAFAIPGSKSAASKSDLKNFITLSYTVKC
jgi:hypothetical protein